jgi:hypothetical protein
MTPSQVGTVTEARILAALVSRGLNVLVPFGQGLPYDLVVEKDGKFQRVQCKTGALRSGVVQFNTSSDDHDNYEGLVDVFAVFCPQNEKVYWVPIGAAGKQTGMYLRIDPPKNGQTRNIRYAKEFELGV